MPKAVPLVRTLTVPKGVIEVYDLGRLSYRPAYDEQVAQVERVQASRDQNGPLIGSILLVEHDPVITVSNRPTAAAHLTATPQMLALAGVSVEQTDRGGDITYHGPGQLVVYPILDLNRLHLRLHDYMRLLEEAVIRTLAACGIEGRREPGATGVWVTEGASGKRQAASVKSTFTPSLPSPIADSRFPVALPSSKIAAMGVRVRRWISMHGLALNVDPNLSHFDLIVPCGLAGRTVTSMRQVLQTPPQMAEVKQVLVGSLAHLLSDDKAKN